MVASSVLQRSLAPWRERLSWALYDFANTVFSMNIASLYFAAWLVADLRQTNTTYAVANAVASVLAVVSIPVFGALSDATQRRKVWVIAFTVIACSGSTLIALIAQTRLPLIGEGILDPAAAGSRIPQLPLVAILATFVIASYAYQAAQPFYNAMMAELAPSELRGRLSGLGAAFGYVGSIIGVVLTVPFFTGKVPLLGTLAPGVLTLLRRIIPLTRHAGRVSTFFPTALLFFFFSVPLMIFCTDHNRKFGSRRIPWRYSFQAVQQTLREAREYPGVTRLILTSFLYQDAMGTIVVNMALYAIFAMGFAKGSEVTLFVVLTIPAVIGSYLIGKLVDRIGAKRTLSVVLCSWVVLLAAMIAAPSKTAFWIVGALIGLIYGGVSTAERPLLLSLVPDVEAGRFFSLMVLSARAAAILGPLIWAVVVDELIVPLGVGFAYRAGVATVLLGMLGAFWLLRGVPDTFQKPGRKTPASVTVS